jgi:LmbE family N-acetylglucosaminyl deacetylase
VIAGPGTPEAAWSGWRQLSDLAPLEDVGRARILIVAPHPDDEVLGLGGLLRLHSHCHVVAVTDGERSHPGSKVLAPAQLAEAREGERCEALALLGRAHLPVTRLRHPDGAVDEDLLARQLEEILRPGDVCAATWRGDGHPDHAAVGAAAAVAARSRCARLWEYPVWTWHWARPGDARVPWDRARALRLDADTVAAKARAIRAFRTQVQPLGPHPADGAILAPQVLEYFARDREIVFVDAGEAGRNLR